MEEKSLSLVEGEKLHEYKKQLRIEMANLAAQRATMAKLARDNALQALRMLKNQLDQLRPQTEFSKEINDQYWKIDASVQIAFENYDKLDKRAREAEIQQIFWRDKAARGY